MRIIDLHCYPGTQRNGSPARVPTSAALAQYWKRDWVGKPEDAVLQEFTDAGVEACLVALDLETTIGDEARAATTTCTRCGSAIPKRIIQCWGALEPAKRGSRSTRRGRR